MVEGAIRHGTTMNVEGNYTDTHGQSEIGFGITRLLMPHPPPESSESARQPVWRRNAGARRPSLFGQNRSAGSSSTWSCLHVETSGRPSSDHN
jgi:TnpA family transposase